MVLLILSLLSCWACTAGMVYFEGSDRTGQAIFLPLLLISALVFFWRLNQYGFADATIPQKQRTFARWLTAVLLASMIIGGIIQITLAIQR